jgi:hypothetical protein
VRDHSKALIKRWALRAALVEKKGELGDTFSRLDR